MTKEKKQKNIFKLPSNIAMGIGLALFAYWFYIYLTTQINLPAGVCPFDEARPFAYAASGFLLVALVLSFFETRKNKQLAKEQDSETKEK